jgi:hypothetical protein
MSSYAASITSSAKKVARPTRPDIEIRLKDHTEGKFYTTYDALSGTVNITASQTARFDEVKITLEGTIRTYVDNLSPSASTAAKTTAIHRFLKLVMPVSESDYPQPRIAESGQTYTFPYNFVIPDQLLPRSCNHPNTADHVTNAHLQLPPSMGDRSLIGGQSDMAPAMSKVQYAIRVQVVRHQEEDSREVVLVERSKQIRVIPAQEEAAPLNVGAEDDHFVLSKTKALKKGMFSGKLGKVTVSAAQPAAIILPAPSSSVNTPATTMATVHLTFDPHDASSEPPRLGSLATKIKASTFYAVRPTSGLPTHRNAQSAFEIHRGVYDSVVTVSSRCVESVQWTKHPAITRRGSGSSTSSSDFSDCSQPILPKDSAAYYSAKVIVPITLPSTKVWIPTFHNCITSRIYVLDLSLSIHTPGTGVPASTVSLRLPLQIGAAANMSSRPAMTAAEAAAELAEVDEFLRPRIIEMPSEELFGNSVLSHHETDLPPSYEFSGVAQAIRS